jgi:lauroyl/myristoyl acyltransferase
MRLKKRLIALSNRALIELGRRASPRVALRLADTLARHMKLDPRMNKRQLRANLELFFPDRDRAWVSETARRIQANAVRARHFDKHFLPEMSDAELEWFVEPIDWQVPARALDAGRGVLFHSLHYGRFWAAPVWFSRRGYLASAFQSARGRLPSEAATLAGGSFNASDPRAALRAARALRAGKSLFLLLDTGKLAAPVVVDFLGHPTRISPSPIRLARAGDALVVSGLVVEHPDDPERVQMRFYEAFDPREIPEDEPPETTLRRVLAPIERQVLSDPSQWYGALNANRRLARAPLGGEAPELV